MMRRGTTDPVFIHALFRAGSTYLFNVFRRSNFGYFCYQEPENEFLIHLDRDPARLLQVGKERARELRHPLDADPVYFREFYQIREKLVGVFKKSFCYDEFFVDPGDGLPSDQRVYFQTLIDWALGRPVLQFCRSAGRIGALKESLGGIHLHLWREARNQWWSFKINDYFDSALQRIYNASRLPPVLVAARDICRIPVFHSDDIYAEFEFARRHPLASEVNYFAFYAFWLYAFCEYQAWADATISIDRLSMDAVYRREVQTRLEQLGIGGADLSDCAVPRSLFSAEEADFYRESEERVQNLFLMHGYDRETLQAVIRANAAVYPDAAEKTVDLLRDARRARQTALRCLDEEARAFALATAFEAQAKELEHRLTAEAARAAHAEGKLQMAQERVEQLGKDLAGEAARAAAAEAGYRMELERAARLEAESRSRLIYIQALQGSRSWRVTAPLRFVSAAVSGSWRSMDNAARKGLLAVCLLSKKAPRFQRFLTAALAVCPTLKTRLRVGWARIFGDGSHG
jgi:hypothetical protein